MNAICQLVRNMPPSDFIWITEQNKMFKKGLGAEIWWRGGKSDNRPESILSKKFAFVSPIVVKK